MKIVELLILVFPISIGILIISIVILMPIAEKTQRDATIDFCNQKGMEYISHNYCGDGENAVEIKVKQTEWGFDKSDYEFYIIQ